MPYTLTPTTNGHWLVSDALPSHPDLQYASAQLAGFGNLQANNLQTLGLHSFPTIEEATAFIKQRHNPFPVRTGAAVRPIRPDMAPGGLIFPDARHLGSNGANQHTACPKCDDGIVTIGNGQTGYCDCPRGHERYNTDDVA